ncbi:serine protease filzig isoform X2 [Hermetia illucens]|uniref:serine protease filzig isoform X2 n=1 Tax=Hermetia illucens TaxID=343691 RepID=UPI0018CC476B|nr:serine protease filzig isoform X2 [Hermetia illucens]XP_037925808.1 serine protease filzig isoform X2 [Hermetia illucens]
MEVSENVGGTGVTKMSAAVSENAHEDEKDTNVSKDEKPEEPAETTSAAPTNNTDANQATPEEEPKETEVTTNEKPSTEKKETQVIVEEEEGEEEEEEIEVEVEVTDDESPEDVSVEQTIVIKKEAPPQSTKKEEVSETVSEDVSVEVTIKAPPPTSQKSTEEVQEKTNDTEEKVEHVEEETEEVEVEEEDAENEVQEDKEEASAEEGKEEKQSQAESTTTTTTPQIQTTDTPQKPESKPQSKETTPTDTTITTQKSEKPEPIINLSQQETTESSTLITSSTSSIAPTEQQPTPVSVSVPAPTPAATTAPVPTPKPAETPSSEIKQDSIKNKLKEIISDIDRVVEQEEKATIVTASAQTDSAPVEKSFEPAQETASYVQAPAHTYLPPQTRSYAPPPTESYAQGPATIQSYAPVYAPTLAPADQPQIVSKTREATSETSGYTTKNEVVERSEVKDKHGSTTYSTVTTTTIKATPPSSIQYQPLGYRQYPNQQHQYAPFSAPNINSYISKSHRSMSLPVSNELILEESTEPGQKPVDLNKIFTPATDAEEILPQKNRKLYASSAFYSPTLHPTVEDQVELARRISHSLSDISNQQSKGQSMYVNRKKRSVKWVHEGDGKADVEQYEHNEETKENDYQSMTSSSTMHEKFPLKLLMNPRGQVQDLSSMPHQGFSTDTGLLSPDKCAELVTALHAPKGKGAELFAKRRKKSEKWIVDETNAAAHSPSGVPSYGRPIPTSPSLLPAYSDLGVQRVQLNMHQDMVQDKYAQPRLKLVKTPWEAALETGSASSAFQDIHHGQQDFVGVPASSAPSSFYTDNVPLTESAPKKFPISKPSGYLPSSQRDLAYKPSVPQGWNAPPLALPKDSSQNNCNHTENHEVPPASNSDKSVQISSSSSASSSSRETTIQLPVGKSIEENYGIKVENFGQTDEEEIIRYTTKTNTTKATSSSLHLHQSVVDCIAKSPELMVAEAKDNYLYFDNTIKELEASIIKPYLQETTGNATKHAQKQHSQFVPNSSITDLMHLEKVKREDSNSETHHQIVQIQNGNDEDSEEYIKMPVKDLISSFEKQSQKLIERLEKPTPMKTLPEKLDTIPEQKQADGQNEAYMKFQDYTISQTANDPNNASSSLNREKGLYTPPEIPLDSYVPPPQQQLPSTSLYSKPYQQPPIHIETAPALQPEPTSFPSTYPAPPPQQTASKFPTYSQPMTTSYPPVSPAALQQKYLYNASSTHVKNASPAPFNPSPLPYDKLAKFDQPSNAYNSSISAPPSIRKPLAVFPNKVRNTSPTPFGAAPQPSAKAPSYQSPQMPSPTTMANQHQSSNYYGASSNTISDKVAPHPYHPPPEDLYYANSCQPIPTSLPPPTIAVDMSQCQNYNTAPRGWNQMRDYYRPITFSKTRQATALPYTDF